MKSLRAVWIVAAIVAGAALAAGCIETDQEFTLNPDGSGKVVYQVVTIPAQIGVAERPEPPEVTTKRSVVELLNRSRGVAAWSDVQYALRKDGRIWFKGTAYFDRFADLKLHLMKASSFVWARDDQGGMVLRMTPLRRDDVILRPPPKVSDAEVAERIKAQRQKWYQTKQTMGYAVAALKIQLTFHLPGDLREAANFTPMPDGSVTMKFEGEKMFHAMDELMADDAFMDKAVRGGVEVVQAGPGTNEVINERVFGLKGPAFVRVAGDLKPLFDYRAEVAAAKRDYPAMMKRQGLDQVQAETVP
jgi:hypothetical protein